MSAERFFDDLARTLAEPMSRPRAVRVIGTSLAAITVPGFRAAATRAAPTACGPRTPNVLWCPINRYPKADDHYCCPSPGPRYDCGDAQNGYKCKDRCPPKNPVLVAGKVINQEFCVSKEKAPSSSSTPGWPVRYACCPRPDTICDDGECVINCKWVVGHAAVQCGKNCCMPGQVCKNGKCYACPNTCTPQNGTAKCCERGEKCCFNDTTAACCGPKQTCSAGGRRATCDCTKGRKCGPDCCKKGETCCGGKECCSKGDTCTAQGCCPKGRAMCIPRGGGTGVCCDEGEYCFWRRGLQDPDLVPIIGVCKKGCAPGNTAKTQCCGTGFKPNRAKTACVPE